GVMLTAHGPLKGLPTRTGEWMVGGTLAVCMFVILVNVSLRMGVPAAPVPADEPLPGTGQIGLSFLGVSETSPKGPVTGTPTDQPVTGRATASYLLPFEIVSVHLLVVLVGAAYLARAKRKRVSP
ncbi:MAG: hypothetical protein K2V38_26170, partial [Gemmataceae bacterium]|nr:hypothetical protein [Gemmataceae bacterium]